MLILLDKVTHPDYVPNLIRLEDLTTSTWHILLKTISDVSPNYGKLAELVLAIRV